MVTSFALIRVRFSFTEKLKGWKSFYFKASSKILISGHVNFCYINFPGKFAGDLFPSRLQCFTMATPRGIKLNKP